MKYLIYKMELLKDYFKKNGFIFAFKKMLLFLFRPFIQMIIENRILIEVFYGIFPNLKQKLPILSIDSGMFKIKKSQLVEKVRYFWYSNIPGNFDLAGEKISRREIFNYGGPDPNFICPTCQKSEWLSRIKQKNLFIPHSCHSSLLDSNHLTGQAEKCKILCAYQGNDFWTHFHQNFDFALGNDLNLPTPKGIYILFGDFSKFFALRLEPLERILRWQFAITSQLDIAKHPWGIDWSKYDFVFIYLPGVLPKFERPSIPVILFAHDVWREPKASQWVLDWLKPDVLLTTYPTQWKEYFKIPPQTKIVFHPMFPSEFFTRPNLGEKIYDLLVIGATIGPLYEGRRKLDQQIKQLPDNYRIEFSHITGTLQPDPEAGLEQEDSISGKPLRFLNKWSEYLGKARYVTFGRMKYPILLGKYYETLGSGAIPIFPEVPDLKLLEVKPFEHYIPLSEIEGKNERLSYFLDHYDDFKYIAKNAVKWYKDNSDKRLFNNFEDLIREVTNYRFPKRLL